MPDASYPSTNPPTVAEIWNKLIADTFTALSIGQRLKDAVGLDTLLAARITDISKISSAAIAVGDTANSIAQKLRGALDNQAFPTTAGMVISSFDNARFSMTASQTTEIIPATGESDFGHIQCDTFITGDKLQVSADSGVNYIVPASETWGGSGVSNNPTIEGYGNSTGRYKVVTSATAGTRIFQRLITTFK